MLDLLLFMHNTYFYLLLNFIKELNFTIIFLLTLIFINTYFFTHTTKILNKLILFFFNLTLMFSFFNFIQLESFSFIFMLTELVLIFFFLIVFTQISLKITQKQYTSWKFLGIIFLIFSLYTLFTIVETQYINFDHQSYYTSLDLIVTTDFFLIYLFLVHCWDLIIWIGLILSLFSIYFILLYYQLKKLQTKQTKVKKSIYFLRKQNMIHQAIYDVYLRWFQ